MTLSLVVFCEAVLALAAVVALGGLQYNRLPAVLFWTIGIGLIAATALAGVFAFAGAGWAQGLHQSLNSLSAGIGSLALLLAGAFSFLVRLKSGPSALIITALSVAILVAVGIGAIPTFGLGWPVLAMIGLAVIALIALRRHPDGARWLFAGVLIAVLAELGRRGIFSFLPVAPVNLYHLLLAVAVLAFGRAARFG